MVALHSTARQPVPRASGIDHVTVAVRDYAAGKRFYEAALRPLGFDLLLDWPGGSKAFFGLASEPSSVWLVEARYSGPTQLAFAADDRAAVDAFYAAALAAGGQPAEEPGFRPEYTARTYAAEVRDPDGNAVEAICWTA